MTKLQIIRILTTMLVISIVVLYSLAGTLGIDQAYTDCPCDCDNDGYDYEGGGVVVQIVTIPMRMLIQGHRRYAMDLMMIVIT